MCILAATKNLVGVEPVGYNILYSGSESFGFTFLKALDILFCVAVVGCIVSFLTVQYSLIPNNFLEYLVASNVTLHLPCLVSESRNAVVLGEIINTFLYLYPNLVLLNFSQVFSNLDFNDASSLSGIYLAYVLNFEANLGKTARILRQIPNERVVYSWCDKNIFMLSVFFISNIATRHFTDTRFQIV